MSDENKKRAPKDDVMHGRSFAGEQFAASERQQTQDIERVVKHPPNGAAPEMDDEVTDAEVEAREDRSEG